VRLLRRKWTENCVCWPRNGPKTATVRAGKCADRPENRACARPTKGHQLHRFGGTTMGSSPKPNKHSHPVGLCGGERLYPVSGRPIISPPQGLLPDKGEVSRHYDAPRAVNHLKATNRAVDGRAQQNGGHAGADRQALLSKLLFIHKRRCKQDDDLHHSGNAAEDAAAAVSTFVRRRVARTSTAASSAARRASRRRSVRGVGAAGVHRQREAGAAGT